MKKIERKDLNTASEKFHFLAEIVIEKIVYSISRFKHAENLKFYLGPKI